MEQSPIVVILLCTLCVPAALPLGSGSELPLELVSELPLGSESELPSGAGMELPSGSGMELPSGSGSAFPLGLGSELPLELGSEIPLGSGSELPFKPGLELSSEPQSGSELPSEQGSELPSGLGLEPPSEPGSELSSEPGSELPSELGLGSEPPLEPGSELPSEPGSELPLEPGSGSELPSEPGSGSEVPSELGSEPPSEPGSGSEPPLEPGLGSEPPSEPGSEPPSEAGSGSALPPGAESVLLGLKAMVVVNSTPCSVTCGLGVQQEQLCEYSPAGERRNCSLVRSRCLREWICGLRHLSVPEGKPFQLTCLSPDAASLEGPNFGYTWRFAPGLITTNDLLFHPFRNSSPSLRFSPALESHSGTYLCDVQVLSSFQPVKRIYFGLRVIPRDLVDLDFQKSLTWEQQLAANGEEPPENATGPTESEKRWNFWEKQWFYEVVLGVGSGVIVGILFSLGLCCLGRICRKRAALEMNED
nr:transmembrane protein 81 isoform X2 [Taeniopygia guttata]